MMRAALIGAKVIDRKLSNMHRNMAKAQARSSNRTAIGTIAYSSKLIRSEVNVKARTIKRNVKVQRATTARTNATLYVKGAHIPVSEMRARQTKTGVTYKPYKNQRPVKLDSAFKSTIKSGHKGVFRRKGKSRLPIEELYGPSIMALFQRRIEQIFKYSADRVKRELAVNIAYYRDRR